MNNIIANRIYNLVANDPAKVAVLNLLTDGKWHTRFEVESAAKKHRATIGLVGICVILRAMQEVDSELLEIYDNDSGRFYRLNPQRLAMIKKIIGYHQKGGKSANGLSDSATEYKRFKERLRSTRKSEEDFDAELKHFL
jgi:hypothetical protein